MFVPAVVPIHNTYAWTAGTLVHCMVCSGLTLLAPFAGDVSVAVTEPVANVLSTKRQTLPTLVHIRAYRVWLEGSRAAG